MKKTCDGCEGSKKRSEEWSLSVELAKSNRRMFVALMVVICLWFATILGFVWYINQFDYSVETETTTELEADQYGDGVNIAANGDVDYGATSNN